MRMNKAPILLLGILLGLGSFSTPVLANTGKEAECICTVKCESGSVNADCPICRNDISLCQGEEKAPEESTVSEEEKMPEKAEPLTPDGNMELVDDIGRSGASGKQFITLTIKSGNFFYIIIDRDDSGNENVHFLNQVDEADLLDLMDEDEIETYQNAKNQTEEDKASTFMPQQEETKKETTEETEVKTEESDTKNAKKSKLPYILGLIFLAGVLAAGGAVFVMANKRKEKEADAYTDPDADYDEREEMELPEEEGSPEQEADTEAETEGENGFGNDESRAGS